MNKPRQHQVSLRGASAREISRDALLEKVNQERELRNYTKRATAAASFIQRVWRRHNGTKLVALQMQKDWKIMMNKRTGPFTGMQISSGVLRPFIFFIMNLPTWRGEIRVADRDCMINCFKLVLESINSSDGHQNFCSLATGTIEERKIWLYQSKKLISVCLFILANFDYSKGGDQDVVLTSLAMRLAVVLTDPKGWKSIADDNREDTSTTVRKLIQFMGSTRSGLYNCIRKFIYKLEAPFSSQGVSSCQTDDRFLIVASAVTLLLRPFHVAEMDVNDDGMLECAVKQYWVALLTIPWLAQRLPKILVPALKHKSVLSPCFRMLLISKEKILEEIFEIDQSKITSHSKLMPQVGWALANVVFLATGCDTSALDSGNFTLGLDYASYLRVVIILAEKLLDSLEIFGWIMKEDENILGDSNASASFELLHKAEITCGSSKMLYMDLFKPICQQWHLKKLLSLSKDSSMLETNNLPPGDPDNLWKRELLNIANYYSCMLRVFSTLNPAFKSLPILNMLSFTPGFLFNLWEALEKSLFPENKRDGVSERRQKRFGGDGGNKWVNVLHKFTGKSQAENDRMESVKILSSFNQVDEHSSDEWDIGLLRRGPDGMPKDMSCLLHLFCSAYSHLLFVLDDIEFYDKQAPFTLEQQRKIASMVNTLVYNAFSQSISPQNKALVDSATRCLHLLYERDCRHQFCPPALWLSPGKNSRPPIAVAARTHEVLSTADGTPSSSMGSVITTTPHIFPFEERVEMFREFINMDKATRRRAGEVAGPGSRSIEIVIRRGHVVEDGFQQLNTLRSKLKSSIHVSFVSESGLPEAGLDYGGLSKEFLTDISKAALSPEYGLFSQASTSDRLLIPNTAARYLENGIQMIEFLGRIVGKALYEGILLDFCFSHVFVQKLLGRYSFLDELSTLDPELYKNLIYVKHYDGDVMDLSLDFTVTEESLGKRKVIELKPGGKDTCVTNENKLQYIHAIADYKLNRQILPFSNAFYGGLTDLISPSWLKLFNASEFNQLLSGGDHDIDVDDLRKNTRYTGGYTEGSRTVKIFWEVFGGFEPRERCMLLKFVTSCSRAPLLGFKHLQPAFTIHKVVCDVPLWATFGGQDVDRLPSASTCYNTLKLPTYKRSSTLRAKLLYAINSNAGFELS